MYVLICVCVCVSVWMCVRQSQSRQTQQPAADYTTECQLGTEVTPVLVHLNTNLLGPLSFGLVSASWFPPSFCLCLVSCLLCLFCSYPQLQISNPIKYSLYSFNCSFN